MTDQPNTSADDDQLALMSYTALAETEAKITEIPAIAADPLIDLIDATTAANCEDPGDQEHDHAMCEDVAAENNQRAVAAEMIVTNPFIVKIRSVLAEEGVESEVLTLTTRIGYPVYPVTAEIQTRTIVELDTWRDATGEQMLAWESMKLLRKNLVDSMDVSIVCHPNEDLVLRVSWLV